MKHRGYLDYVKGIKEGKIVSGQLIKQAVARFEKFMSRDDVFFDEKGFDECVDFIATMKHFLGKSAGKPFVLEPFQEFVLANLFLKYKKTGFRICTELYMQVARKALALDTPILTTKGWTTIGEIAVGDCVYGADGKPVIVDYITPVFDGDCYEVEFEDGEKVIADADHEWYVKNHYHDKKGIKKTLDLLNFKHTRADGKGCEYLWRVPMNKPLAFDENPNLPIDPYVLGLWLGDGTYDRPQFTCHIDDIAIYDYVSNIYGNPSIKKTHGDTYAINYFDEKGRGKGHCSKMTADLRNAGVWKDKHIPEEYLRAGFQQRLALLQGLMDTDGCIAQNGMCEFDQVSKTIVDGLCSLLSTLGIKYTITEKTPKIGSKEYNTVYRVRFFTDKTMPCFKLERKYERLKDHLNKRMEWKSIVNIRKVENCKVKCIGVNSEDHLFLFGNRLTATHNCGKDAFMAALALYLMTIEGEASPEIVCAANSTDQARILFNYIDMFSKSIDKNETVIEHYRNYVKTPFNNGICKVISSDASKADGMNLSAFFVDEYHEAKDRRMYDVLKSSQGMREQPLAIIITTAGFNLEGPCHDMYELGVQVLGGVKEMDNFFPFIWQLDPEDAWDDPKNFIKCQPNLGITVTTDYMLGEVNKAKVDPTAETGVKTKTLNMWCSSELQWIKPEVMVNTMKDIKIEDYEGYSCTIGVDLSSVGDMSALAVMIPIENKRIFLNWSFLPEETYVNHPNKALYEKFHKAGELDITPGNIIDYDYISNKIAWINTICPVTAIYYDPYNSSQWAINMTELGYNLQPYGQNIGNMTRPTKEFQRLVLSGEMVMQKSSNFLWQIMGASIKEDMNQNVKVVKTSYNKQKIDNIIACITALGGFLKDGGIATDFDIFVLDS